MSSEKLIKTRHRVQQHGEVFTPVKIVKEMIALDGIKDKVLDIRGTFLEPSVGEGVFLVEILKARLKNLIKNCLNLSEFENKSLLALSTLYGIELLEDNAQKCVMNIYMEYVEHYDKAIRLFSGKKKKRILESAKTIIAANIQQGNFLTRLNAHNAPIVFSEWREKTSKSKNTITVVRTEHSLEDIYSDIVNPDGYIQEGSNKNNNNNDEVVQLTLFDFFEVEIENNNDNEHKKTYKYIKCSITNVYKEEMEEYEG